MYTNNVQLYFKLSLEQLFQRYESFPWLVITHQREFSEANKTE